MADMEAKCLRSFTFHEGNKHEYREDQTPYNPRRTDNDMHNDRKKDERSKNWQVLCGGDSVGFTVVLVCCQ